MTGSHVTMTGTEAFTRIVIPADIGKCHLTKVKCKVDTGTGSNVMPLCTFAKLFQMKFVKMDPQQDSIHPPSALLLTTVLQSSSLGPSTPTSTGHQKVRGPSDVSTHDGMLLTHQDQQYSRLSACHKLRIIELNCAVDLQQMRTTQQRIPTTKHQRIQDDLETLKTLSSR